MDKELPRRNFFRKISLPVAVPIAAIAAALTIKEKRENVFQDGEALTAEKLNRALDEVHE